MSLVFPVISVDQARSLLSDGRHSLYAFDPKERSFMMVEYGDEVPDDGFLSECYVVNSSLPRIRLSDLGREPSMADVQAVSAPEDGGGSDVAGMVDDVMSSTAERPLWQCPVCREILRCGEEEFDRHVDRCSDLKEEQQ